MAATAQRCAPAPAARVSVVPVVPAPKPALFNADHILAFAIGNPSDAFGDRYNPFDAERTIARLPGPPYQFLDRIVEIENCQPWQLTAGGEITAEYDVPVDAWYFVANRQREMSFAVLLEVALQPCGWLAAYLGSALTSDVDLSFRNLGGNGVQHRAIERDCGVLSTKVKITNVASSGGMIIQNYDLAVSSPAGLVYEGDTYFGFFSKGALANQVGMREVRLYRPTYDELARGHAFDLPDRSPYPSRQMRMVDHVELFDPAGGPEKLGFLRGSTTVDPEAWFFKAHFHQDPVWPGSLGLESFLQLLKVAAIDRWARGREDNIEFETMAHGERHAWTYRGQILPTDRHVTVEATIRRVDDERRILWADGYLSVDSRVIYQMNDFAVRIMGL